MSISAIIVQRNGLYLGLGKTGKGLLITPVFFSLTFKFEFYSLL